MDGLLPMGWPISDLRKPPPTPPRVGAAGRAAGVAGVYECLSANVN